MYKWLKPMTGVVHTGHSFNRQDVRMGDKGINNVNDHVMGAD